MTINNKAFQELVKRQSDNCISIYIPTYRANNAQESKIRFKNALSDSVELLMNKAGMEKKNAESFLEAGYQLLKDDKFWHYLSDGLVMFISDDSFEYHLLPIHFNTHIFYAQHFYTRPLLPILSDAQRFFLLTLSQNKVRFFEGNQSSIIPVKIDDLVPENLEAALRLDNPNAKLQMRGMGASALYHGHGLGRDNKQKQLEDYFRQIDKGLLQMLHDEDAPLLIAAVDYLVPIYKSVSNYKHIVEAHIAGNPEQQSPMLLQERAWELISKLQAEEKEQYQEEFADKVVQGKASATVYDIIPAAMSGRVETLFINKDSYLWGNYDNQNHTIHIHTKARKQSDELIDLAARNVVMQGGTVYNIPSSDLLVPQANVNAIFRY